MATPATAGGGGARSDAEAAGASGRGAAPAGGIRRAGVDDLDALSTLFGLYRRFYGRAPDAVAERAFLADRLRRGESVVLLAEPAGGGAVGFVQLYPTFDSLAPGARWVLYDLYVVEDERSRGWGSRLLEAAEAAARDGGALAVVLETARDNLGAQRLYERRGYVRDEVFLTYEKAVAES